ncbi:MAG TPA: ChbG/HpnK family deacetylase [Terracidiphilus sp.]|nr:ChbG/HpnK family deacetylase [Terracidiphilus sp.]
MTRLIVNADDFGQTAGINRAVLELHKAGVVTSATLMARAAATDEAIEIARAMPTLGVGCHIVLTDGEPILDPARIPSLIDGSGSRFIPGLGTFLGRLLTGRIRPEEIEMETTAQIRYLQSRGLHVTHVDTHKHTHMFPRVLRSVLRGARACGIHTVRNPFEPIWAIRASAGASLVRRAQVSSLRCLQTTWRRILAEEGFATTGGTLGVSGTGALNAVTLHRLVDRVPAGTWELVTHPGYNDGDLARVHTRLRASRDIERKALPVLREFPALQLVAFSALTQQQ